MRTLTGNTYGPLGAYDLYFVKYMAIEIVVDLALYGVQMVLSIAAISILARRQAHFSRFTLAAILGLLLFSTVSVVATSNFYLIQFPSQIGTSTRDIVTSLTRLDILIGVAHNANYLLSDAVLVWRAWRLWPGNRLVKGSLLLCICGSLVGCTAECIWRYWITSATLGHHERIGQVLVRLVPLLATNVVVTVLIGTKIMYYSREIRGSLGLFTQQSPVETALILLLESGLAYCLFWIIDGVLYAITDPNQLSVSDIFASASHHIAGFYPTCVLFVALRGTTTESLLSAQMSQAMRNIEVQEEEPRDAI